MFLNTVAYHLQQCVEKMLEGALECVGVTVPDMHRIPKLLQMTVHNGANLRVTEWIDDHAEMLGEWEAESCYNMDFIVERRKIERAVLKDQRVRERLLSFLPESRRTCSAFELNCYYIMFEKQLLREERGSRDE